MSAADVGRELERSIKRLKERVISCIRHLLENEPELLKIDANERSISYRLGMHLDREFVADRYHVDCEYNRFGYEGDTKLLEYLQDNTDPPPQGDPRWDEHAHTVFPDITVHVRMTDTNVIVIEIKKTTSREEHAKDKNKLKALTNPHSMRDDERGRVYHYKLGLFLELKTGDGIDNPANLIAKGIWFVEGNSETEELQTLCDVPYNRPVWLPII